MKCRIASLSALLISALVCAQAHAQVFGYAVNSDANNNADRLVRINLSTGESQVIGRLGEAGADFVDVESLSFNKAGVLFGVDDALKTALTINLTTGRGTALGGVIGNTRLAQGDNAQDPGITFSCADQLYLTAKNARTFYKVSSSTGSTELIGALGGLGVELTDIAARGDVLYGLGHEALYRVDATTGKSELVGSFGADISFAEGGGLAVDSAGQLWAVAERRTDSGAMPSRIYRVDSLSGAATFVANTVDGIESLAIGPTPCDLNGAPVVAAIPTLSRTGIFALLAGMLFAAWRFGRR